ncbi:DUF262 domain-containing protein [Mucilaginibacter rubeus]|uniref:DUF262 domain-containing protein n=1 Tax=Mucilaginibacter rubeus TaxID=2027860 RepID=UPI00166B23EC|nr:DUF262 domain-containing protein [Mucilaginibacter rubeus]GGA96001.1 hypothetical protein GCM10011500_09720 [Mucilaginibacter rubeus]
MNNLYPVIDLFGNEFNIPAYQRGYRWGEQEVTELLNDLWEFQKTARNGEFYCLQPIVVKKTAEKRYNLIDGQQRLTTLYLILVYLEERRLEEGYDQPLFSLTYETRKDCVAFLKDKLFENGENNANIDYHYICNAYGHIKTWFQNHPGSKSKLVPILLDNDGENNRNVKLIWYDIGEEHPIDAFIRLNVGKIPLTDAELIKALLLQSDKYTEKNKPVYQHTLFEIGAEWDTIEYGLQREEFWYFLNNGLRENPTHIELIFDLIAEKKKGLLGYDGKDKIKHRTYLLIAAYLDQLRVDVERNKGVNPDEKRINAVKLFWEEVTTYYGYFLDWYRDRRLYHYIGFLITMHGRSEIDFLINEAKVQSKEAFITTLISRIYDAVNLPDLKSRDPDEDFIKFEDLCYDSPEDGEYKKEIHNLLLLHNVIATLNSDKELARFPFNLYKQTKRTKKWSLEHIHAQNSDVITNPVNQKLWLSDHVRSLRSINTELYSGTIERMKRLLEKKSLAQDEFNSIFDAVNKIYNTKTDLADNSIHKIGNLCLVDADTNAHLNNSVFDVKREKIKKREVDGHYIPLCTRNAFLKAYTSFPQNNYVWDEKDRKNYIENIQTTLDPFLDKRWKLK